MNSNNNENLHNTNDDQKESQIILQRKPSLKDKFKLAKQDAKFYKTDIDLYNELNKYIQDKNKSKKI
jgi:hypothetical protein